MAFTWGIATTNVGSRYACRRVCVGKSRFRVRGPSRCKVVMSAEAEVGVGDVVVIKLPYEKYSISLVTKVGGKFADVIELEAFGDGLFLKKDKASDSYEPLDKMRVVSVKFDEAEDGYRITEEAIEAAKSDLESLGGATTFKEEVVVPEPAEDVPRKDFDLPFKFRKPTKKEAFAGTGTGLLLAVLLYQGFLSARSTFSTGETIDLSLPGTQLLRNVVLFGFWGGSLLSLVVGGGLLYYALKIAEDDK